MESVQKFHFNVARHLHFFISFEAFASDKQVADCDFNKNIWPLKES